MKSTINTPKVNQKQLDTLFQDPVGTTGNVIGIDGETYKMKVVKDNGSIGCVTEGDKAIAYYSKEFKRFKFLCNSEVKA